MTDEKINNYCTNQNITARYPNGSAGKFIITCLFLFDHVAHWSPEVQHGNLNHWDWFKNAWSKNINDWSIIEPNQPWAINFYSRRLNRNNTLTQIEYNQLVETNANSYFRECWVAGLNIIDHFHKKYRPEFHANNQVIEINLSDKSLEIYKHLVKEKLWLWDETKHSIISTLDHPDYSHNEYTRQQRLKYKNEFEFIQFQNYDDFFENYLLHQPYVAPFVNAKPDPDCLLSLDLLDIVTLDRFIDKFSLLEQKYNQPVNHDLLVNMHTLWKQYSKL